MKGKYILLMFLVLASMGVLFSDNVIGNLSGAADELCSSAQSLLKVGIILMIVLGAATYAIGQILSSEIRGRATVWATSMFMAALFAAVIYVIVPWVIGAMWGTGSGLGGVGKNGCDALPGSATYTT